jgi:hypothetical protein
MARCFCSGSIFLVNGRCDKFTPAHHLTDCNGIIVVQPLTDCKAASNSGSERLVDPN